MQRGQPDRAVINWRLPGLQQAIRDKRSLPSARAHREERRAVLRRRDRRELRHARYLLLYLQERGLLHRYYREFRAAAHRPHRLPHPHASARPHPRRHAGVRTRARALHPRAAVGGDGEGTVRGFSVFWQMVPGDRPADRKTRTPLPVLARWSRATGLRETEKPRTVPSPSLLNRRPARRTALPRRGACSRRCRRPGRSRAGRRRRRPRRRRAL